MRNEHYPCIEGGAYKCRQEDHENLNHKMAPQKTTIYNYVTGSCINFC